MSPRPLATRPFPSLESPGGPRQGLAPRQRRLSEPPGATASIGSPNGGNNHGLLIFFLICPIFKTAARIGGGAAGCGQRKDSTRPVCRLSADRADREGKGGRNPRPG